MSTDVTQISCPACGAPVAISQRECEFCHGPVIISTFRSVLDMPLDGVNKYASSYKKDLMSAPSNPELNNSIAFCYLKLKLYEKAYKSFEQAIAKNIDNSESYFYAAVSLLKGKKAFFATREVIDQIEEYINAATMIEPKGIYYYFHAYVKYDYFFRKHYKTEPSYGELLHEANSLGFSLDDSNALFAILSVEKPQGF